MNLTDVVRRRPVAETIGWAKIPWDDPEFSGRMLNEHLSQKHDAASRRFATIEQHVGWIHDVVLGGKMARVLDLGCGPGFYTGRLAKRGHACAGIDFSPASIAYARAQAEAERLSCDYRQEDIRTAAYGAGYDLIMLIFGELNAFTPDEARLILQKAHAALEAGRALLLEVSPFDAVRRMGERPASWYSSERGLFSDQPYLCLTESAWDAERAVAIERYFVVDAASGAVTRYVSMTQAYTDAQYRQMLGTCGFGDIVFYPSLEGEATVGQGDFVAIVARKQKH